MIVGAGGFGKVLVDPSDDTRVIKRMKAHVPCVAAQQEFDAHQKVHAAYRRVIAGQPELQGRIEVPAPYGIAFHEA
jgi:hypothetical protein